MGGLIGGLMGGWRFLDGGWGNGERFMGGLMGGWRFLDGGWMDGRRAPTILRNSNSDSGDRTLDSRDFIKYFFIFVLSSSVYGALKGVV
jgi:hypothetical protein